MMVDHPQPCRRLKLNPIQQIHHQTINCHNCHLILDFFCPRELLSLVFHKLLVEIFCACRGQLKGLEFGKGYLLGFWTWKGLELGRGSLLGLGSLLRVVEERHLERMQVPHQRQSLLDFRQQQVVPHPTQLNFEPQPQKVPRQMLLFLLLLVLGWLGCVSPLE